MKLIKNLKSVALIVITALLIYQMEFKEYEVPDDKLLVDKTIIDSLNNLKPDTVKVDTIVYRDRWYSLPKDTVWLASKEVNDTIVPFDDTKSGIDDKEKAVRTATIISIDGEASVRRAGTNDWETAEVGMEIKEGDILKTGKDAKVPIQIEGDKIPSKIEVEGGSQVAVLSLAINKRTLDQETILDIAIGKMIVETSKPEHKNTTFKVKTPTSIIEVQNGGVFTVDVNKE